MCRSSLRQQKQRQAEYAATLTPYTDPRSLTSSPAKSAGGGTSQVIRSPVCGWMNPSRAACSIGRAAPLPSGTGLPFTGRSYTRSPHSGAAGLAQVNPHLVRPARLQPALDQRELGRAARAP